MIHFIQGKLAAVGSNIFMANNVKIADALKAGESIGLTKAEISRYAHTSELWLLFSGIGVLCIISLILYQKFIGTRVAGDLK